MSIVRLTAAQRHLLIVLVEKARSFTNRDELWWDLAPYPWSRPNFNRTLDALVRRGLVAEDGGISVTKDGHNVYMRVRELDGA